MSLPLEYSKYKKRLFKGLLRIIFQSFILTFMLIIIDIDIFGIIVALTFFGILALISAISIFKKSRIYLWDIRVVDENFEFELYEFDEPKDIIRSKISETRIKLWEVFFPIIRFGRNYKLIIETKQGITYKRIIQQYELGNWTLDEFKEIIESYGKTKGVPSSTKSFTRSNYSTNEK